jgi:GntR family transcriptional regulator / MocR family aminotransferase
MLTFFLDKDSEVSLYEQLYQNIKKAIEIGELKKNEKLPSKRKLASHLEISQTTVETAYMQLLAEGYIKSIPRVGFFVMINLDLPNKKRMSSKKLFNQPNKEEFLCDFYTNQVDQSSFPYEKLAKMERDIILDKLKDNINRGDIFGNYDFRKKIADILFAYRGIIARPEQIVVGSGSENLISLLVLLLGREKTYAVEDPSYIKNYLLYKAYGVLVKPINLDNEGINISLLESADVDIVHTTPSHQFPKGIVTSISRRLELLNWSSKVNGRYIIEDDYDSEFRFFGNPIPAMKGLDNLDHVIYMNSFSKTLGPSFRISFLVLPEKLINVYRKNFSFYSCSVPTINQLVLERFIDSGEYEKHLNRMKTNYKAKRDKLISLLNNSEFAKVIQIVGEESGLHFLVKINTERSESYLVEKAKEEGVRVYGLSEYSLNICENTDYKTIVFGYSNLSSEDMKLGIKLLEKAWENI